MSDYIKRAAKLELIAQIVKIVLALTFGTYVSIILWEILKKI